MNKLARLLKVTTKATRDLRLQEELLRSRVEALRALLKPQPGKKLNDFCLARLAALEAQLQEIQEQIINRSK